MSYDFNESFVVAFGDEPLFESFINKVACADYPETANISNQFGGFYRCPVIEDNPVGLFLYCKCNGADICF